MAFQRAAALAAFLVGVAVLAAGGEIARRNPGRGAVVLFAALVMTTVGTRLLRGSAGTGPGSIAVLWASRAIWAGAVLAVLVIVLDSFGLGTGRRAIEVYARCGGCLLLLGFCGVERGGKLTTPPPR